jgi:hypothetical protein
MICFTEVQFFGEAAASPVAKGQTASDEPPHSGWAIFVAHIVARLGTVNAYTLRRG